MTSKRRSYSNQEKLEMIGLIEKEELSLRKAARRFGVPRACLAKWIQSKSKIEDPSQADRRRAKGQGKRSKYAEVEEAVLKWIK